MEKQLIYRQHLHELLDQACNRCQEGEFVASHFVTLCLEEAIKKNQIDSNNQIETKNKNNTISAGFGNKNLLRPL